MHNFRKVAGAQAPREFESPPLRQNSGFGSWAIIASPHQRRGSTSAKILKVMSIYQIQAR